jgi:chromosome segregation ATPase
MLSCLERVSYAKVLFIYLCSIFYFLGATLDKIWIAERSAVVRQVAHVAELEEANALLRAELDTAHSKLAEVEHRERTLTSENEGPQKDLENARTAHDTTVKDKVQLQKAEPTKLQQFQDSVRKKLAKLRRDIEVSVATLGGGSTEFHIDAHPLCEMQR